MTEYQSRDGVESVNWPTTTMYKSEFTSTFHLNKSVPISKY